MPTLDLNPAWTTNTGTSNTQSGTFSPQANSLIIAVAMADSAAASITCTFSNSAGLSMADIGTIQIGSSGGACHACWMYTVSAQTNMTVTATWAGSGTTSGKGVKPITWLNTASAAAVTSQGAGVSGTNSISPSYNNTVNGSRGAGVAIDWNQLGVPASTDDETTLNLAGSISGLYAHKAADTSGVGTSVPINFDAAGTGTPAWAYKLFEILPAAGAASPNPRPPIIVPNWAVTRAANY